MVKIIFSLDVEDYITPEHDEAVKFWAELFYKRKIKGCFNIVGEVARVLKKRNRKDVIGLLRKNEIGYHSNTHSLHPTFPEYLDAMDWDSGVKEVIKREKPGIEDTAKIFGKFPSAYMQPGSSFAPQVLYAMRSMGIPVMECTYPLLGYKPMWYCDCLNGINWDITFDSYFENTGFEKMKTDFNRLYEKKKAEPDGLIVLGTHPCKLVTSEFWDGINFNGKNTLPGRWKAAPLRPIKTVKKLTGAIEEFIDWVLKKPGVEVITCAEFYNTREKLSDTCRVSGQELLLLAGKTRKKLDYKEIGGRSFSPADIFGIFSNALAYYNKNNSLPVQAAAIKISGPVLGFPGFSGRTKIEKKELMGACKKADDLLNKFKRVPSEIKINKSTVVGPGVFIKAMAAALLNINNNSVIVEETDNYPRIAKEKSFADLEYKGKWLFLKNFEGRNIIEWAKMQSWTLKPATPKQ